MDISDRLRAILNNSGLSQSEFADKIGTTQATLSRQLNNKHKIDKQVALAIKAEFGVNPNWLLTGEGDMFLSKGNMSVQGNNSGNVGGNYGNIGNISGNTNFGVNQNIKNIGHVTNNLYETYESDSDSSLIIFIRNGKKNKKSIKEALARAFGIWND